MINIDDTFATLDTIELTPNYSIQAEQDMANIREHNQNEIDSWVLDALSKGPIETKEFLKTAAAAGYGRGRLFKARARLLGVIRTRKAIGGKWIWEIIQKR